MSSFSTVLLIVCMFFICVNALTIDDSHRELTDYQIEIDSDDNNYFPGTLPVLLKRQNRTVKFSFTKRDVDYNIPIYTRTKSMKPALLETPPIKNAAFYEDKVKGASVTLHCEENDPLSSLQHSCNERLMSGFFHLDGHRHVIEPKRKIVKRFELYTNLNTRKEFMKRHQVFKIFEKNYKCGVKYNIPSDQTYTSNATNENERVKRDKVNLEIEVMAVSTHQLPVGAVEIKNTKIYYIHVFYGVNMIYNHIDMAGYSFNVRLTGLIIEPHNTSLYVFPGGNISVSYLNTSMVLEGLTLFKQAYKCDHLSLFSLHTISDIPAAVGFTPIGMMCKPSSVSLIKTLGNFREIFVLAHELGHGLSSPHDESTSCPGSAYNIMSKSILSKPTIQQSLNHYNFSSCSLQYMKTFVSKLQQNCLLTESRQAVLAQIPTGQLYNPTQQCRVKSSFFGVCSDHSLTNSTNFCIALWCSSSNNMCQPIVPAFKTTCGNKKWCIYGKCVYDEQAPLADESCLYGDEENLKVIIVLTNGTKYQAKSCMEVITLQPGFCQSSPDKKRCCDTCFNLAHPGNKMTTVGGRTDFTVEFVFTMSLPTGFSPNASVNLKSHFSPIVLAILQLFQFGRYFTS